MDMRMPVMGGLEATRYIKASPSGKDTVIIALTASAFEEDHAAILFDTLQALVEEMNNEPDQPA